MTVGWPSGLWYGVVIALAGRLRHAQAAVPIEDFERGLELHYHSLGGALARRVVADAGVRPRHKSMMPGALLDLMAWLDPEQVHLPKVMDRYPTPALNRELYFWLAAFLAEDHALDGEKGLPLGIRHLLRGVATSARLAEKFPALALRYRRLCVAELAQRISVLPGWDGTSGHPVQTLEAAIRYALGAVQPPRDPWLTAAIDAARRGLAIPIPASLPGALLPFLPVPLWVHPGASLPKGRRLFLKRSVRRRDVGDRRKMARPRFDPRQPSRPAAGAAARGAFVYPEWDHERGAYRPDWCAVSEHLPGGVSGAKPDETPAVLAAQVRRQFEALRQLPEWDRRLDQGDELDVDACVESISDRRGCGALGTRIYRQRAQRRRDLSVAILMDSSRSTEAWVGGRRVIGIAREAMRVLAEALSGASEDFGLFAFASDSRLRVRCYGIKNFDERYDEAARGRLLALKPENYTRMGAAIRHVGAGLEQRPFSQKLLLVLTDGRPNDPADGYEGKYALEDTRRALLELRARGMVCFGLTIDQRGREYLPRLFGAGHYAVFSDPHSLPRVLPKLYAGMTARPR